MEYDTSIDIRGVLRRTHANIRKLKAGAAPGQKLANEKTEI